MFDKLRSYPWLLAAAILAALFCNSGFRRLVLNFIELRHLRREYVSLLEEQKTLQGQLDRIRKSNFAIESAARKDLGFVKPGEFEYRFPSPAKPAPSPAQ